MKINKEQYNELYAVEDYDILTGYKSIVNPDVSSEHMIKIIKNA